MTEVTMTEVLDWDHAALDIPEAGLVAERAATPEERKDIARTLEIVACTSLLANYTISPRSEGHFRLSGTLTARVEQTCVVTLEPLTNDISESYSVDFWPERELPVPEGGLVDVHDEPDMEPILAGRIEAGRIIFECLAGAIDLFPRKPGATFEHPSDSTDAAGSEKSGPFAALAKIRQKR
jgi:hypothetical protein